MNSRRNFLKTLGAAATAFPAAATAFQAVAATDNQPNVVIILADDMGANDCAANVHRAATYTPNLERLAKSGITFTDGYTSASTCTPSRVGMLSGRNPSRFGVYEAGGDCMFTWPKEQLILPQYLKRKGYRTGIIGKWHCGGDLEEWKYNHPLERGFDRFWGFMGSTHDYFESEPGSGVNGAGYWSCGYNPIYDQKKVVESIPYLTDAITEQSVRFIRENRKQPFFLYVAHHCPHVPLQAPREVYEKYLPLGYRGNTTVTRAMQEILDAGVGAILEERRKLKRITLEKRRKKNAKLSQQKAESVS